VAAAALAGWWYARESTPHQGPIVLISIDGLRPATLQAYGAPDSRMPAIDALSAEAVVFERAYTHSPLTLPAHASMLAGQLPFEHGVRDEAGFVLKDDARSLAELLRNRGFDTGAAVSSFVLRPESGVAQGFSFFDAELPEQPGGEGPAVERDGMRTTEAAERWLRGRRGHRFFLLVQVDEDAAESTVTRLVGNLKERGLYDQATIVVTADRAEGSEGDSLDEAALRVPFLVKQPDSEGAGRRVAAPVQHIDILPTVLDLVRAPIPSGLRGRSLRPVLDGDEIRVADPLIYAESLSPLFRFGGPGRFSVTTAERRYVRGGRDEPLNAPDAVELGQELDRLLGRDTISAPSEIDPADEDRFAMLGYLGGGLLMGADPLALDPDEEAWVTATHHSAAILAGQKKYGAAIGLLREVARAHPRLAVVQYQLGVLLGRVGRLEDAVRAFRAAASVEPDNPYVPIAVTGLLLHARRPEDARAPAALAVALAEHDDRRSRAAAHQMAARVALAREDAESAEVHAEAAERDDPALPMRQFVRGTLLFAEGRYEEARAALEAAAVAIETDGRPLEELHASLGDTLARLERYTEAEEQFREELRAFPRSIRAHSSLALLYHASNRTAGVEEILDALVEATGTPEGYESAARLWTIFREPARAAALRADARARFRGGKLSSSLSVPSGAR